MIFEYDINKSMSNKQKHGIDFERAKLLWDDANFVELDVAYEGESRSVVIGAICGKCWTAVITYRGKTIRIISVRRSREREVDIYGKDNKI
ncbi:MAG: BrnT family toxin [Coriobacteriia bacterium]|jgi:uncharacterized DUF497 family protein|nr:BrnT family toxin [Coriobacteriia bacterium]MDR2714170.1 BrnT family toxin [Coriobacteriales bacterium]